jgi:hypothetical protein
LSATHAWVWADIITGALWYYANKLACKIGFTDMETRVLAYRIVFECGEPQYVIRDSEGMQSMLDEIAQMGGLIEPRGQVDGHPYF